MTLEDAKQQLFKGRSGVGCGSRSIERYLRRCAQAEATGEVSLAVEFDTTITDESNGRDELRLMLALWP